MNFPLLLCFIFCFVASSSSSRDVVNCEYCDKWEKDFRKLNKVTLSVKAHSAFPICMYVVRNSLSRVCESRSVRFAHSQLNQIQQMVNFLAFHLLERCFVIFPAQWESLVKGVVADGLMENEALMRIRKIAKIKPKYKRKVVWVAWIFIYCVFQHLHSILSHLVQWRFQASQTSFEELHTVHCGWSLKIENCYD